MIKTLATTIILIMISPYFNNFSVFATDVPQFQILCMLVATLLPLESSISGLDIILVVFKAYQKKGAIKYPLSKTTRTTKEAKYSLK